MGRRKIAITPLLDERNRSVTFNKRRAGLFKKAFELGVLCSADIAVIVFSPNGKCFEYSSGNLDETLLRYSRMTAPPAERKGPADFNGGVAPTSARMMTAAHDEDDGDDDSGSERAPLPAKPTPPPEPFDFSHGLAQLPMAPGYGHAAFAPYFQPNMPYPAFPGFYPNPYQLAPLAAPPAESLQTPASSSAPPASDSQPARASAPQSDPGRATSTVIEGANPPRATSVHPTERTAEGTSGPQQTPGTSAAAGGASSAFDQGTYPGPDFYGYAASRPSAAVEDFVWPTYDRASPPETNTLSGSSTLPPISLERKSRPRDDGDDSGVQADADRKKPRTG